MISMEWYLTLIIVLGFLIIGILVMYWWYKLNFTVSPTGTISENIVSIKNRIVNVYIYTKGTDRVVIDTGSSAKRVKKEFLKVNMIPEEITDVFMTHTDPDHIGGLLIFKNANIYFGKDSKLKYPEKFKLLADNDIVMVGSIKIQAISTPGHRLGHTSYLINDEYLFTGDLLRLKAGVVKPFFKLISADFELLIKSIKKVAKIENVKILLTAHSGYSTEFDKSFEKILA
jgi:glyoxylase-like metal-dependent hydrolase (beta-lactamase superfamily II)